MTKELKRRVEILRDRMKEIENECRVIAEHLEEDVDYGKLSIVERAFGEISAKAEASYNLTQEAYDYLEEE